MTPETLALDRNGWMPNNPHLPVLLYRRALQQAAALGPGKAEALLTQNWWPAQWRDSVFSYHHYHSTAHEALAVIEGGARVTLGGPGGRDVDLELGDVVVLPAGTGHCLVEARSGFTIVGAYPEGQEWDILREAPDAATLEHIACLPWPDSDPIEGADGALPRLWTRR